METVDLLNLVLNGGSTAILLWLLIREQSRFDKLTERIAVLLERGIPLMERIARLLEENWEIRPRG